MTLEISELLLPAIVIQILLSIKELVCHTFDKKKCIPKLALEIQDLSLLATVLLPRLDDTRPMLGYVYTPGGVKPDTSASLLFLIGSI
jgi:hypothetical protein